jgi:hypothetical protein
LAKVFFIAAPRGDITSFGLSPICSSGVLRGSTRSGRRRASWINARPGAQPCGQPLPIPVTVDGARTVAGKKILAADLNLAPLAAGDYVLELTAGRGGEVTIRLLAFRVVQ